MKRLAVIVGIVIGIVAFPAMVAASGGAEGAADKYARAQTWNSPVGELYGPVQSGPASYGFIPK